MPVIPVPHGAGLSGRCARLRLAGLPRAVLVAGTAVLLSWTAARAVTITINVAPPCEPAAIERALVDARRHRLTDLNDVIVLQFAPGTYRTRAPIVLGVADAGAPGAELILRGAPNNATILSGAAPFDAAAGIATASNGDAADGRADAYDGAYAFFSGDARLRPARLPERGFVERPLQAVDGDDKRVAIAFAPEEFDRLALERHLWISGYFAYDWQREEVPVVATDAATSSLVVQRSAPFPPRARGRVAVGNTALGLGGAGTVLFDPVRPGAPMAMGDPSPPDVETSVARGVLDLINTRWVRVENVAVVRSLGPAVTIRNSQNVVLEDCYIGQTVGVGLVISGGTGGEARRCVIADTTESGVILDGGDRRTLTPGGHRIVNSIVAHVAIAHPGAAVQLRGVGNVLSGSLVAAGPQAGVQLVGNDHAITGNEFLDLAREVDDAGILYMGRDWTQRGNRIIGNFIHDFGPSAPSSSFSTFGIYLDDQFSGADISGNVIVGGRYGVLVGGGRDNHITDNLFVAPREAGAFVDDRGLAWQQSYGKDDSPLMRSLRAVDIQSPEWAARYPALAALPNDHPGAPVGTRLDGNLAIDAPPVKLWRGSTADYVRVSGSRVLSSSGTVAWTAESVRAVLAGATPPVVFGPIADRRAALATLPYAGRAGLAMP